MTKFKWTNESVARFAQGEDPIAAMENAARNLALKAIDQGWSGPPFDLLALADSLKIPTEARPDIADARTVPTTRGGVRLEYNPLRPRGRLRFSIAHEIAHTLFPDCNETVRNRGGAQEGARDDWQLEVLCNIGAAELLMPLGSFSELAAQTLSIDNVLKLRKEFDVSVEACMIRIVRLSRKPALAFCASAHTDGKYRLDYVIPAAGWEPSVGVGTVLPADSIVRDVSAIGYTATGNEVWDRHTALHVECVGLAPYPGQETPRVVGLATPRAAHGFHVHALKELRGDALHPAKKGQSKVIAHVVPNTAAPWGGGGFASQVRRQFPAVWKEFQVAVASSGRGPELGSTVLGRLDDQTLILHMVAQQGIGASPVQRLRYASLAKCLTELRQIAEQHNAGVHMPRIGTGHGGANWNVVKELIVSELVDKGVDTTIYQLPS